MKNKTTLTDRQIAAEEIERLSALSDSDLIRWARTDGQNLPLPSEPCSQKDRNRLIRRIRLTNRLVYYPEYGTVYWTIK